MTPDPEQERAWRERIGTLFEGAPEPDAGRLAMALSAARVRRRRSRHRALALLAGAILLGGGMATAAWWTSGPAPTSSEPVSTDESKAGSEESMPKNGSGDEPTADTPAADDGIIYQRAE